MTPCHSCYIYRIWRSKEVGGSHNLGWQCKVQGGGGGGNFYGEWEFSACNTAVLKLYCKTCWVL